VLEVHALTKRFGGLTAVDRVSFRIPRGEILGYLGPNGSGKSTTIRMLVGLLDPSSGTVSLDGVPIDDDPIAFKRRLGYVPEEPHLYTHLTAPEYLALVGRLRGLDAAIVGRKGAALLDLFGLHDARYAAMSAFSKGMRQRVLLAAALLHDPELIVLDEPFSGLDVSADLLFRTFLQTLSRRGRMILFSSHRLDVVEKVCERVVILHRGRVVADDRVSTLREARTASLEDVFAAVTSQDDPTRTAEAIVDVVTDRTP
jgi:ABC-2 type transport system ATP-binding protein